MNENTESKNPIDNNNINKKKTTLELRIENDNKMGDELKKIIVNDKPVITECIPSEFYFEGIEDFSGKNNDELMVIFSKLEKRGFPYFTIMSLIKLIDYSTAPVLFDDFVDIVEDKETKAKTYDNSQRKSVNKFFDTTNSDYGDVYKFYKRNKFRRNMTGVAIGQVKILEKNNEISSENKKRFDDIVLKFMGNEKGKDFSMHNYCFNMDNQQKFALIKEL